MSREASSVEREAWGMRLEGGETRGRLEACLRISAVEALVVPRVSLDREHRCASTLPRLDARRLLVPEQQERLAGWAEPLEHEDEAATAQHRDGNGKVRLLPRLEPERGAP